MRYNSAKEVVGALTYAYYEERNIEAVLSCVADDVEWIGTECKETAKGKEELAGMLNAHFITFPNALHVEFNEPKMQVIDSNVVVLTLTGEKIATPGALVNFSIRGTIICMKTEQGWLVFYLHMSAPNAEVEKVSLQNALDEERTKQIDLLDHVPGGIAIYRVKKDGRIPADYISDNLARICGYEHGKDALKVLRYDSRTQVLPEDYPIVAAACKASIENGAPTSVQYRVYEKDGNLVCITLDSVIMKNVPLGEDDVAVFYAVQTLVSKEATQKAEKQEALISLLNTVPAGIGVFEVDKNGIFQSYINDAFYHLIGAKREDRIQYSGKNTLDTVHPKDLDRIEQALKQLLNGENSIELDYRIMGGSGSWVWLHLVASAVERMPGKVKLHVAYYECTERKQQQLKLLQNQKAVTLAEEQGRISIWIYNIDKDMIEQQSLAGTKGHSGYPAYISNVPQCFVDSGSIHPEDIEKFLSAYDKVKAGDERVNELFRIKDRNTERFNWVRMYYQRMDDNDDGDRMAVGFSLEVNKQQETIERYQTEKKLREQMYATAVIYMEYDLTNSVYVDYNNLEERYRQGRWECPTIVEYRENMSENVEAAYLDEVTNKMYAGNLLKAFESGVTRVSCEYRSKERQGKPSRWYRMTAIMVKRPDTGNVMAFVYVEDIEKEKVRQLAIESGFGNGIDSVAVIRLADGQAWTIQIHNNYVPKELGKHFIYDDAFVRKAHRAVIEGSTEFGDRAALLSTVMAELEKQEVYQYSLATKRKGDEAKRQLIRFRYLDDRKTNVVISVSDITSVYLKEQNQKKQLEAALSEATAANHAKTNFLSRVSHDMRTPLNGILGLTTLLKDSVTDHEVLRDLDELEMSGKYLLNLINDTLDMNRIETGNMELHPTVYDGRKMFNNALRLGKMNIQGRDITFNIHTQNTPFTLLYVDVSRVEQIFMNVFGNAVKFTPDGGTIDFTMTNVSVENGVITNKLVISDTGIGMSPEFLPHIFEAFSQADTSKTSTSQGTGLGMAITKQLIELMGGSISVESELGKGTTFTLILKLHIATDEQIEEWKKTQKVSTGGVKIEGKRVLLVEDHPLNAKIAIRLLETKGVVVEHAENGQIGVDMFGKSIMNYYDAILMDIRMPVMDGIEATKAIRHLVRGDAQTVPIIAMTANAFADDIEQTQAAGMNGHLSKPIQTAELYATLAEKMRVPQVFKKQRVLVVDDEEVNRVVLRASLEKEYEILEAENGNQAMDIIKKNGVVDAVITDIQMPQMDGVELIRKIRSDKKNRNMVIIANTQYGDSKQEELLLSLGVNDFIYKSTAQAIVELRIRNALKQF